MAGGVGTEFFGPSAGGWVLFWDGKTTKYQVLSWWSLLIFSSILLSIMVLKGGPNNEFWFSSKYYMKICTNISNFAFHRTVIVSE